MVFFINDQIGFMKNILKLYADDGKIFDILDQTIDGHKSMQDDIDEISKLCHTWKIELNVKKCSVMHNGKKTSKETI